MAKLIAFPLQTPRLPRRLLKDCWWLVDDVAEKPGAVVAFPATAGTGDRRAAPCRKQSEPPCP